MTAGNREVFGIHLKQTGIVNKSNVVQHGLHSYQQWVHVIAVVKMLWTQKAQLSESTTNFYHCTCDDTYLLLIRAQTTLNHTQFVFYHNIKDNERNLCQDLLTIDNWQLKSPTRTWKCRHCIMQMSHLYASDFPFKNFCKLVQHAETKRKKCLGKEQWRVLFVDKSMDHAKPHFDLFSTTISTSKKMFFSEHELKKTLRDTFTQAACYGLLLTMAN